MQRRPLQLDGEAYTCVVATRMREQRRGLAGTTRAQWAGVDGLLIPFPFLGWWPLWMRGMQFAIDIFWLRSDRVVDVRLAVGPHPWRIYLPRHPCTAVFERISRTSLVTPLAGESP